MTGNVFGGACFCGGVFFKRGRFSTNMFFCGVSFGGGFLSAEKSFGGGVVGVDIVIQRKAFPRGSMMVAARFRWGLIFRRRLFFVFVDEAARRNAARVLCLPPRRTFPFCFASLAVTLGCRVYFLCEQIRPCFSVRRVVLADDDHL